MTAKIRYVSSSPETVSRRPTQVFLGVCLAGIQLLCEC